MCEYMCDFNQNLYSNSRAPINKIALNIYIVMFTSGDDDGDNNNVLGMVNAVDKKVVIVKSILLIFIIIVTFIERKR